MNVCTDCLGYNCFLANETSFGGMYFFLYKELYYILYIYIFITYTKELYSGWVLNFKTTINDESTNIVCFILRKMNYI
jgi:hypothetical protein